MRQAKIYNHNLFAGVLTEDENGYAFHYDANYLQSNEAEAIILPYSQIGHKMFYRSDDVRQVFERNNMDK